MVLVNSNKPPKQSTTNHLKFEMMSANKWVKVSNTNSTGTQTDPVSISLKSRREMGFKIYPKISTTPTSEEPETQWMDDYWEPL